MLQFLWKYHGRIIPIVFLLIYEAVLIRRDASFDDHMLAVVLVAMSFVTWPDESPESSSFVGYHPLPAPFDIIMAVTLLLLPGLLMLVTAF